LYGHTKFVVVPISSDRCAVVYNAELDHTLS
jgi:hypothetical protein